MVPLIIIVLIGIVLFLPVLLGIILVLFVAYGAYLGLKWLLTREREERNERKKGEEGKEGQEGKEGRLQKAFRNIRKTFSNAWNSRPSRVLRERTKGATVTIRKAVKETGGRLKTKVSQRVNDVREKGSEDDPREDPIRKRKGRAQDENPPGKTSNKRSRKTAAQNAPTRTILHEYAQDRMEHAEAPGEAYHHLQIWLLLLFTSTLPLFILSLCLSMETV